MGFLAKATGRTQYLKVRDSEGNRAYQNSIHTSLHTANTNALALDANLEHSL